MSELLLVAFSRWRIERCFEDQKGEVGLDHYEGRRYRGMKRHYIITMLSYLFLSRVLSELREKKSRVNDLPDPHGDVGRGAMLVAVELVQNESVRTSSGRDRVYPEKTCAITQQSHKNNARETAQAGHIPKGSSAMQMEHDLAL